MLIVLFSFLLSVSITLQVMQIDFERLEQLAGFDIYNSSLRVRKYNRTAVALNGTIHLLVPLNESIMVCRKVTWLISFTRTMTFVETDGNLSRVSGNNDVKHILIVTSDFFHSRLGNQQFNHYPVKFPTQQVCKFLENFYTDYSEYVDDFGNLPAKGECPIKPCKIDILNKPFPAKAVPPFFPS
ncbi:uncharacterized protein LOC133394114 [Anopheles gambiae]|uniref:uncharacterized protein LOC133394114 n=1 Tax=Anopheles gambiae TaxID=7165 RepID=UPI002AC9E57C|nr:uncharacterized protein LOC133394114 [Anopheles gambiae]